MFITGLGTATPPHRYSQQDCWEVLKTSEKYRQLNQRAQAILKKVLRGDNGIHTRHLALDDLRDAFRLTPDELYARFAKHAPLAAGAAVCHFSFNGAKFRSG
jgi:alkylresorcinol/alkylpyrone synthase